MFLFSLATQNILYITHTRYRSSIPTIQLLHIPYKSGSLSQCLLIYEWFYNLYTSLILSSNFRHQPKTHIKSKKRRYPSLSIHHLLFLVYIIVNVLMVVQIHAETLPIHILSILPTTIGCAYLFQCYQISIRPHYMPSFPKTHHYPNTTCPSLTPFSSNHEKLCYLHAW